MNSKDILRAVTSAFGVSGFEDEVGKVIADMVRPLVDEVRSDVLGNLIATRRADGPTLMLDAHMDELGFVVSHIEKEGFLRFTQIGGWDHRIVPSHAVVIRTREGASVKGVVGTIPPHLTKQEERERPPKLEDMFVDVGATSAEQVAKLGVRLGDPMTVAYPFEELNANTVMAKALDDRVGCAVIIRVLQELRGEKLGVSLACVFSSFEEEGLRGAKTAAYALDPRIALCFEGTIGADVPGIPAHKQPAALGRGPAVSLGDNSIVVSRRMLEALEAAAARAGVPFQYKKPKYGSTDAGVIHQSRRGVLAGVLSVPCRYIHAPYGICRLDDFENTVKMAVEFVRGGRALAESLP
jgi:endoglucanase